MASPMDILTMGESRFVEFKREFTRSMMRTVSAFANFHDGRILVGVDDSGSPVGLQNPGEVRLQIENAIHDHLEPYPSYWIETVLQDERTILVLHVLKGESTPYYCQGRAYVRSDTATVPADAAMLNRLILEGQNRTFDELPSDNQNLSFRYLEQNLRKAGLSSTVFDDLLKTLELIRGERYTRAAALLSDGNPIRTAGMVLVAFRENTVEIEDRMVLEHHSILEQFDTAILFHSKHLATSEQIEGARRTTWEEVPLVAYREAIANALVHRDYTVDGQIRVEFHSDHVAIVSPGSLPLGISEIEYRMGRLSIPRNRIIDYVFLRLGLIERMATGVRRILALYRGRPNSPEFQVTEHAITVLLPRSRSAARPPDETPLSRSLTPQEEQVLSLFASRQEIRRRDVETLLGLGKTRSARLLSSLAARRLLLQKGDGRATRYVRPGR